jgi:FAD:protein FMN transferase
MSSKVRASLIAVLGCVLASGVEPFEAVEPHMGTLVRIKLYAGGTQEAEAAFRAAFDRIAQLDEALSDYKSDSELNRICRSPAGRPVKAGPDLVSVLEASQQLAGETSGAFDVTLGPVIRLWRQARLDHRLPAAEALKEAAARSGFRKLRIDAAAGTVTLDQPGMQLDLGGIAKGYAADAALAVLAQSGIQSALVAVSGDLAFSDPPPGQSAWKIGAGDSTRIVELRNAAVSTSGSEEQHLDIGGKRYSHIVDPSTDIGLTRPITVTVIARRGVDADSLATAVSVLGPVRGMALMRRKPGVAVLIVTEHGVVKSPNWPHPR